LSIAKATPDEKKPYSKRTMFETVRSQLELERSSFATHWRDLGEYILPRRPRFNTSDTNRGDRRNQKIIDSTATLAARTLRSGMMSGVTSPARPWFRLSPQDTGLEEVGHVKDWLYFVSQRMSTIFTKSNLYNCLPIVYGDIGVFGTGAMSIEEDMDSVIRCYPFAIGSYSISNNDRLKVDTFFRDFRLTVRQIVEKFAQLKDSGRIDWSNCSSFVRDAWDRGQYETWVDLRHTIRPNEEYDPRKALSKFKKYQSVYYEVGTRGQSGGGQFVTDGIDQDKFLSEKGYDYFPILCPRWEVTGEDAYGTSCPGMDALGDIKQLQLGEKRAAQAIEKMVNPPMTGPASLRNQKASILPGDITYVDVREGQQGYRPAHEVNLRLGELENKQQQIRGRIQRAFYEDLFLMLAESDRREITAREVEERHEEKLLALGPVLEQLNQDLLDPLIDNTFQIMLRQRMIPPPPKELQGMPLRIEYISIMAQAQKLIGIAGIERFHGFIAQAAQVEPSVKDKVNYDQMADIYGDMTSLPPGIVRTDEEVQAVRQQQAQAVQAQQQSEAVAQGAQAAKNLSQADTSGKNALTELMQQAQAGNMVPQQ
jgi:hypothetical protein